MSTNRRTFLASAAFSCLGLCGADRIGPNSAMRQRQREEVEKRIAERATPVDGCGYLDQPAFAVDKVFRPPQVPYEPQPGDIFFGIRPKLSERIALVAVGAFHPSHSGIMIRNPDGCIGLLESGCQEKKAVMVGDPARTMSAYLSQDRCWIRRRCVPLTPEQDCRLTEHGMKQVGKRFAQVRMYGQATILRSRGPLRTFVVGRSHGTDRISYFCDELVTELIIAAGLMDARDCRPAATFAHDLFWDQSFNPYLNRHFKLGPNGWCPPAQWRAQLCSE